MKTFALNLAFFLGLLGHGVCEAQKAAEQRLSNGTWLMQSDDLTADALPCDTTHTSYDIPVESSKLDFSYLQTGSPAGVEITKKYALGQVSIGGVSLSNNHLVLTLTAIGDGKSVKNPVGSKYPTTCIEGRDAHLVVAIKLHYLGGLHPLGASFKAPRPDVRMALDFNLIKSALAGFNYYKLGQWIRLGEAPYWCGDRTGFDVHIKDPPTILSAGYLNPDGAYGTTLSLGVSIRAQVHGCLGDPLADAQADLSTTVGLFGGGNLPIGGSVHVTLGNIFSRDFPLQFAVPVPAITNLPIDFINGTGAQFAFGTFDGKEFKPAANPTHKDVPVSVNISSFGGPPTNNNTLIIDATVAAPPQSEEFSSAADAAAYLTSDDPLWDNQNLGVSVHDSFFGSVGGAKAPTGILASLLPFRVTGESVGTFHRHFEIVFDEGSASFVKHEGGDAVSVNLTAGYLKIGHWPSIVGRRRLIKKIKATVLFDRIVAQDGTLKFRVADFHLQIRSWFFVFPIKLSSGQLEAQLNGGSIPLTGKNDIPLELPICVFTGLDKLMSPPGTCGPYAMFERLGYIEGPRAATFTIDSSTIQSKFNSGDIGGHTWQGLQASARVTVH